MNRIVLDGTDLNVSKIGFGTAALHHSFASSERLAILRAALDGGITHFDSARVYGYGIAEKALARLCVEVDRHSLTITTKIGFDVNRSQQLFPMTQIVGRTILRKFLPDIQNPVTDFSPEGCDKSFANSLSCLNTEYVDILFVHEPALASLSQLEELIPWLELQKSLGKARYIGLAGENLESISGNITAHDIFDVFQTSKQNFTADKKRSIKPQIEYGYFSSLSLNERRIVMEDAASQKGSGMILYSSRQVARVSEFCAKFCND